ncbi:MAG: ATP synthase F1 subunit epsilon [Spirochaetaceae bacterium]|jgi:F-type H+-transporting ATPase subunit epsilon|nr:ATP synthase F1 subunit epsilon [Spirochaetaceae bacterium]
MAPLFKLEIHTPYRRFFSGEVEAINLTLADGEISVYANHSFFTAPVVTGILKIKDKTGTWKNAFIAEGILEVKSHNTILMADAAEWPEEIDRDRALLSKTAAQDTINSSLFKFESTAAEGALKRAEFRLRVKDMPN